MNSRLEDLERLRVEHNIYADLASTLTATLDLSEILNIIMKKVGELLNPENWSLLLVEDDKEHLSFEIAVGEGAHAIKGNRLKVGEGIAGWVAATGESVLVPDAQGDPRFCNRFDAMSDFTTHSIICVPMVYRGKVLGVIELINRIEDTAFTDLDMRALQTIAEFAAIAIQNAKQYRKVHQLSITDDHTSLYNVRFLYGELDRRLAEANERGGAVSIIFLDLDHFKDVNDVHGHLCGSKMLREVGLLIKETVRASDIAVRYGGDEFLVLMPGSGKEEALRFAKHLRERVRSHVFLAEENLNLHITASYGVASYPCDAKDKKGLLSLADGAMYKVKGTTRDAVACA
ncbi:MAG: GGDEF domain-containing protein [Syntrophobacteraceae bacterium]